MNVCRMLIRSRTNPSGRIGGSQSGEEYEVGMDTMDRVGRGAVNDGTVRQFGNRHPPPRFLSPTHRSESEFKQVGKTLW
uniref:Uncharacterized protein n=1 Tax=Picea glauca TaxID=3330 RepID=A0A101LUH5_PICGL|nr:hypothetical protein ABT39_MTgene2422 [Picea glauca]QHR86776.1 hypothetical protein Q903MT_gene780 [Picea sitchensis]